MEETAAHLMASHHSQHQPRIVDGRHLPAAPEDTIPALVHTETLLDMPTYNTILPELQQL